MLEGCGEQDSSSSEEESEEGDEEEAEEEDGDKQEQGEDTQMDKKVGWLQLHVLSGTN